MSIEAMRKALNYIENTEGELGIKLSCGDALREALAAQPPAAPVETGRNRDPIHAPDGRTWYQTALDEASKRGANEQRIHELEEQLAAHPNSSAGNARAREELARDVIKYVMANDILTQHGMKGLRSRLEAAIPDDVALFYDAMLQRVAALMSAQAGTRDGLALDILASGIEAYEKKAFPFPDVPQTSPKWRHLKRGSIVTEVARGFAQVAHHPIEEMTAVVIYRHDADGLYWVRNAVEFDDGRFEPYDDPAAQPPTAPTAQKSGVQAALDFDVEDYVRDYEFRGEVDYKPTPAEQELLIDAIHGVLAEIAGYDAQPPAAPVETCCTCGGGGKIFISPIPGAGICPDCDNGVRHSRSSADIDEAELDAWVDSLPENNDLWCGWHPVHGYGLHWGVHTSPTLIRLTEQNIKLGWEARRVALTEPQVAPTQPFYGARCAAYPNCSGGCGCGCTHEIGDVEARIAVLSDALKRISKNTCCDNCQEAARVARSALGAYVGLARQPEPLSRSSAETSGQEG